MGICISVASSEIHGIPQVHDENVMIFEANKVQHETHRLCSVYSKKGTKGLNQDAASLYQVCLSIIDNLSIICITFFKVLNCSCDLYY